MTHPQDKGIAPPLVDLETVDALLQLATPETAYVAAFLCELLADGDAPQERKREVARSISRLLLLDVANQDLQAVLASATQAIGDAAPTLPEGPLRDRFVNLLTFLAQLPADELREVIHRVRRTQHAERMAEAATRFGVSTAH